VLGKLSGNIIIKICLYACCSLVIVRCESCCSDRRCCVYVLSRDIPMTEGGVIGAVNLAGMAIP